MNPNFFKCAHCGKLENLRRCDRCKFLWYCCRECQISDWRASHKDECLSLLQNGNMSPNIFKTEPSRQMLFAQLHLEPIFSHPSLMVVDFSREEQIAKCERWIPLIMKPFLGEDANSTRFAQWLLNCCDGNFDTPNSLELAVMIFDACLNQMGKYAMKKAWNILGECLYYCGSLPASKSKGVYFFLTELSKQKFDWKELFSEEDDPNSTGPTLLFDFSHIPWYSYILNKGERPKCITDDYVILSEEDANDEFAIRMVSDYHAWCVDLSNNVHDYPPEQISRDSPYWTDNIVRRPWDTDHLIKSYPHLLDILARTSTHIELIEPLTQEEKLAQIADNTFPIGCCLQRAIALRDSDPTRFVVQIGSLGFVQDDESVFWELG